MVRLRLALTFAAATIGMCLTATDPALASDPLPNDTIALPPNINIFIYQNRFVGAGTFTTTNGTDVDHTRIAIDISVLRLVHTFKIGGFVGGVQVVLPIVKYLGSQKIGGTTLPAKSGFAQPDFGVFFWPVNLPKTGTYVVLSGWVSPPISSFKQVSTLPTLTSANNMWYETLEAGARTIVLGTPTTRNLAAEMWTDTYFYQNNPNYAAFDSVKVKYREQPTEELRLYLTYLFAPKVFASTSLGFYQSFGGKQTVVVSSLPGCIDTSLRANESQLRFSASSFIAPTVRVGVFANYDVAAHGGPKQRAVIFQLTTIF